jgi:diguanylate cyclase (GGDEF)-like protein/PAS domain S-box-containing protein
MAAGARASGAHHGRSVADTRSGKQRVNAWSAEAWRRVVESAPEGIVICDATARDCPVVFLNAAFEQMCGYPSAALLGNNLRLLQGTDRDQEARTRLAEAVGKGEGARVLLRNYRPDGSMFWNEALIQPVRTEGKLSHFVSYHRDAGDRLKQTERSSPGLPSWMREDRLTGLRSRAYFEELLRRDWALAQRDSHELGLTLYDIDDLGAYNDKFDRSAGDACIRRIARVVGAAYRRGGDLVARWEGGTFAVLAQGEAAARASQYAQVVTQRVRELLMHHPTAGNGRYVTLSAGIASLVPPRSLSVEGLLRACHAALKRAKKNGKDAVASAEANDFPR